jgi:hypothetical protein
MQIIEPARKGTGRERRKVDSKVHKMRKTGI